ncbi:hypothetical protein Tco_0159243 [Tanacetum coccineum]
MTTLTPVPPRQSVVPTAERADSSQQGVGISLSFPLLEEYYNPTHGLAEENNNDQAPNASFQEAEFINPFCTRVQEIGESSSRNIDNTDVHLFQPQSHINDYQRSSIINKFRGNLNIQFQTRRQLATDPEMCMFALTAKYALEIPEKAVNSTNCHSIGTPLATKPKLDVDLSGEPVDQSDYRSKIRSLMYLTSSRPDLVQAVCYCARYQARPTQKHLKEHFQTLIMPDALILAKALLREYISCDKLMSYSTTKPFAVNLYHEGVFVERPLEYTNGDFKVIDDVDFDGLLYVQMYNIIRRVVLVSPTYLYFKLVDQPLVCLKPLKTDEDVGLFVKALYENGSIIDLYCEHNGYDIMEMIKDQIAPKYQALKTPFKCNEENDPEDDIVDKHFLKTEGKCAAFKGKKPKDKAGCSSKPNHAECTFKPETKKNGQCKRAKACGLYDHEGGLVEHYSKLWEYRQVVLESNPCNTSQLETKHRDDHKIYVKRMYICFKGIKQGWLDACRRVLRCSTAFKNGISKSFNSRIVPARGKAKYCLVYPSGYRKVEVRRGDVAYGVNLHTKKHGCNFWELSGIPCVYSMAAYYHMNMDLELGVNEFFSKQSWYNAYQYSIRPVLGSKLWKPCDNPSPLPLIERKRPDRPRKQRIRHPTKDDNHVSRVGRVMHFHTC